ncbi:MAG TPA: SRPBCC domain-containing protein [Gemmataceae bacterium]|jgi:carbon monoxide dehydrogenase subunit G|nr:SRPBCC domain-containing protein [Gemmataceae bacterium]
MLHFEGDRDFPLSPVDLWAKLRDARFLVTCIPEATVQGEPERDKAACSVRPGFAFAGGSLDTTVEILDGREPAELRFRLSSKGIGTSSEVETVLTIAAAAGGSRVHWVADVKQLGGLLKAVPSGLIRGAAQKTIADIWDGIAKNLPE